MKTELERRGEKSCASCTHAFSENMSGNLLEKVLVCHRFPPTCIFLQTNQGIQIMSGHPVVTALNFCNEWEHDPERVINENGMKAVQNTSN